MASHKLTATTPQLYSSTKPCVVTALAMPGDRERCLAAGADAYLAKPLNLRTLAAAIETYRQRGIAVPPVPPAATRIEIGYPSNEVERITEFVTAQSEDEISAFYRAELPAKGWTFQCQLPGDEPCGRWSAPVEGGVVELYRQPGRTGGGPTLAIFITPPGSSSAAGDGRVVTLRECCLQQYP